MNIEICTEFKALIPPLSIEEYSQLEKNIIADGCREPLVVFNNTLVDGHNRYEICTKHDLPFSILEKDFTDSGAAKLWMIDNQNGRRNLTDGWKYQLTQSKKEILQEAGKENLKTNVGGEHVGLSIVDKGTHNTRDTIASELGWSTGKVAMADKVWKDATPEIKEQVLTGEVSINEAYKAVKAGDTHVGKNSGENEWYTPERFIEAARLTMGQIDLDPASSERANKTVKAGVIYTIDDDGLAQDWFGNVWMNPPYAQPLMTQFAEKLISELPELCTAIVLVNNATETKWFQLMAKQATAICFPEARIKFIDKEGKESGSPLQGQTFLYFGSSVDRFKKNFSQFGFVMSHAE
jgi:ParB family chromosome partitioning protein